MRRLILTLAVSLTIAGCATTTPDSNLRDREWSLVSLDGFPSIPAGVRTPTIRFGSDERLSGNTGCNSASAAYTVSDDRLTIGALLTTKRACVDPNGNDLEGPYLGAVEATRRFRITGSELELIDESGKVVARFRSGAS